MKKYKGFTKPIKKKLDNIERLYNYWSKLLKYNVYIKFDDKFIEEETSYMIELKVSKYEAPFITTFSLYFSEIYIKSNEYIDIYRDICKQTQYIDNLQKGEVE